MINLVDTHSHLHWPDFDEAQVITDANQAGVSKIICVGTDLKDSELAVQFAQKHKNIWASVGVIPHEATKEHSNLDKIANLSTQSKVVAIGEIGLDYYYHGDSKTQQREVFEKQLAIAIKNRLPVIFHVREAFADFWDIVDNFKGIRGVIHSFTASKTEMDAATKRGLYLGINGIITFAKQQDFLAVAKDIPLQYLMLETDAPYLTPVPLRGKINESKNVRLVAEFLAKLRGESLEKLAQQTSKNAHDLFGI